MRRLLWEGYVLEDVTSEDGAVEALFRRGSKTMRVRFLPSEAEALLLAGPLRF